MEVNMFQAYRVKSRKTSYPGVLAYTYRNCSIVVSHDHGKLMVSIAAHDFEKPPALPEKPELNGLLSYFGIDPSSPYNTYCVGHRGVPGFGDTHYFVQPA